MSIFDGTYWAGSEDSLVMVAAKMNADLSMRNRFDDPNPVTMEVQNGIGLIKIHGPTITTSSWVSRYYQIASYDDILQTLEDARTNKDVKLVVLHFDSPGGNVKGLYEVNDYLKGYSKQTISFTAGQQLSAAALLGSACSACVADKLAELGSIGVIGTHTSYKKMDENMGIDTKVYRSAPFKALGHPAEERSKAADDEIQAKVMDYHTRFEKALGANRKLDAESVTQFANGKVYTAAKAKDLGLIDDIMSFSSLIKSILKGNK